MPNPTIGDSCAIMERTLEFEWEWGSSPNCEMEVTVNILIKLLKNGLRMYEYIFTVLDKCISLSL